MPKIITPSIITDTSVAELLNIMQANRSPEIRPLLAVLDHVGSMEKQLEAAMGELAAMRRELAEAQKQDHPVRTALKNAVIIMQGQALELREKLAALKETVINGCKDAAAAFRDRGINALDGIARFFNIRPTLESLRDGLEGYIEASDRAVAKIKAVSAEYHEAGRHLKNIGRAMAGKEAIPEAKPAGKAARAFEAPFKAERKIYASMKKGAEAAIGAVARLEEKAAERKPPIRETMDRMEAQAAKDNAARPAPARSRTAEQAI